MNISGFYAVSTLSYQILQSNAKRPFGKWSLRDSVVGRLMIQALDVDRAKPWADGPDREEDQALPVGPGGRGVG